MLKRLKGKELLNLSADEIEKRLMDLRNEYSRLKGMSARGTLKKESGMIKSIKRNIARLETAKRLKKMNVKYEVKKGE